MELTRRAVLPALAATAAVAPAAQAGLRPDAKSNQSKALQAALEKAIQGEGVLRLPAGSFRASDLAIAATVRIEGVPGQTRIVTPDGRAVLAIADAEDVSISGVIFDGGDAPPTDESEKALVAARNARRLSIQHCGFVGSRAGGLRLESCSGRVCGNRFADIATTGLFARDSAGLEISGNHLADIGNNAIQVWRSEPGEDGTIVAGNRIERVAAKGGGSGQNGNGVNVYKAGSVMVGGNRISDCAFSGVRNNSGSNCQILGNSIARTGEVAIYCEFAFEDAVVADNLLTDVAFGISITNFDEGGRLAVVANNIVRKVAGGGSLPAKAGVGIAAEADTLVTGNVVEGARDVGIALGWGRYCRNLTANGNLVRNCGRGIAFSVSEGAEPAMILNNRIAGSSYGAIVGRNFGEPATGDLGNPGAVPPPGSLIAGNLVN
jgi:uncharacterized secreted repeat protein (TIGR03808 family)